MSAMRKTEDHHHTPDDVRGYLTQAFEILDDVQLDESDRITLLPTLVNLLSSKQVFYEQVAPMQGIDLNNLRARH